MTMPSTAEPTTSSTVSSKARHLLIASIESRGGDYRLRVCGGPYMDCPESHEWRFSAKSLDFVLVREVEAVVVDLTFRSILGIVGLSQQLSFEQDRAAETR